MNIEINEVEFCKLNIKYQAEKDDILAKKSEIVNEYRSKKSVPGFRPGKATPDAISIYYSKEIHETLKQQMFTDAVMNVIAEKDIKPFGYPQMKQIYLDNQKFTCEFDLNKKPDFELKEYKGFEIPKASGLPEVNAYSQEILQNIRMKQGTSIPFTDNDFIQEGDGIILEYEGRINGEIIPQLSSKNGEVLTAGKINVEGFNEQLLGMKQNEERDFTVKMPAGYDDTLTDKMVDFHVKLNTGSKHTPAALDDELAKKLGLPNLQEMLNQLQSMADSKINDAAREQHNNQVMLRLLETHDFKIPDWIILAEAQVNAKSNNLVWDNLSDDERLKWLDTAAKNVKISLILERIRDNEPDAQLSEEELYKIAQMNLSRYGSDPNQILTEVMQNGQLPFLFNRIRDEFTLDFITKNCTIVE